MAAAVVQTACGRGGEVEGPRAQLGNGTTSYATSPVKVVGLEDLPIADISAGGWHSLALTTTGGALPPAIWNLGFRV